MYYGEERTNLFLDLDRELINFDALEDEGIWQFYLSRLAQLVESVETTDVTSGMTVWQYYNLGAIARTESATLCFDISPAGRFDWAGTPYPLRNHRLIEPIFEECDVSFTSHWHGDHWNKYFIENMIAQGKTVIAPAGTVEYWEENTDIDTTKVTVLERIPNQEHTVDIGNGRSIEVIVYPGYQRDVENNLYVVTTDGMSIAHTGDLKCHGDRTCEVQINSWIYDLEPDIDVLVTTTGYPSLLVSGLTPEVLLAGHYYELGHITDTYLCRGYQYFVGDYRTFYDGHGDNDIDTHLLFWGESIHVE